jgi:hypothetical protein
VRLSEHFGFLLAVRGNSGGHPQEPQGSAEASPRAHSDSEEPMARLPAPD